MSLAPAQDVILFSSLLSLPHSIIGPLWWAAVFPSSVIQRLAYGDPSLGALRRTKVADKLFSSVSPPSLCVSFLSTSIRSF